MALSHYGWVKDFFLSVRTANTLSLSPQGQPVLIPFPHKWTRRTPTATISGSLHFFLSHHCRWPSEFGPPYHTTSIIHSGQMLILFIMFIKSWLLCFALALCVIQIKWRGNTIFAMILQQLLSSLGQKKNTHADVVTYDSCMKTKWKDKLHFDKKMTMINNLN